MVRLKKYRVLVNLGLLKSFPKPLYLCHISSLQRYFDNITEGNIYLFYPGSVVDIAKMFSTIEYPGVNGIDAICKNENHCFLFICNDTLLQYRYGNYFCGYLFYNVARNVYEDPYSIYYRLRENETLRPLYNDKISNWYQAAELAVLVSRYNYIPCMEMEIDENETIEPFHQKLFLEDILTSKYPERGLRYLLKTGFMQKFWPEIALLDTVEQNKEYHPEGNGLDHTLSTFQYRKSNDVFLALSLLLHDCGKVRAKKFKNHKFYEHAQIGSEISKQFLDRLGYTREVQNNIAYVIKNHMYVPVLHKIPGYIADPIVHHPYFTTLMELGKCDTLSSYGDLKDIQKVKQVFKKFLKS